MSSFVKAIRRIDWVTVSIVIVLVLIGLAAIYSVDLSRGGSFLNFRKQLIAASIGFLLLVMLGTANYTFLKSYVLPFYIGMNVLLLAVLFVGHRIRSTTGWFSFGGFSFQPVEFAKFGVVFALATYFETHNGFRFRWKSIIQSLIVVGIPAALVLAQPDFGGASILFATWFLLLLVFGMKGLHLISFIFISCLLALVAWFFVLVPYQKDRIQVFLNPLSDPVGAGYNVRQSTIAIGAGRLFGRGLGFGSQSQLKFLPESQTDFIFAVIAEELGFVMSCIVVALYAVLLYRFLRVARRARDDFSIFLILGIAFVFGLEFLINVGMNLGVTPVMGIALPFLSYGGSSLIMHLAAVGVIISAARKN